MLPDGAAAEHCCSHTSGAFFPAYKGLLYRSNGRRALAGRCFSVPRAEKEKRRKEIMIGTGKRAFSKIEKQEKMRNERQRREIDEMKRLLPDRLNDPLLDVGSGLDPYALSAGRVQQKSSGGQNSLHRVEGVRLREWDDALTVGELNEKYRRAEWLRQAEEEAITLHHKQRSRGTVPSYGQALAMATLMEQMHLEEDGYDPYRLPYWIRASFIMEERWGELEAEFNAGKEAMRLAEEWGVSEELQAKLDANAPELFEGEPDLPPVPNAIDDLLEIALPGTAGYNPDLSAQTDFIRDILPEGDDDPPASGAAKEE